VLHVLYQRLRQAGKPPELAFVAVARKLLVILNAIARGKNRLASLNVSTSITIAY